ncbi:hypothetical protein ACWCWD_06605 [Streptomyces sp. NPDC001493]
MTAKAPTQIRKKRPTPLPPRTAEELELRRWTPEEVVELQLLPYRSVRVLKSKCYRREVHCHLDGGRITFTADDLRRENDRTAVVPFAA